jgi:hypothetical protein
MIMGLVMAMVGVIELVVRFAAQLALPILLILQSFRQCLFQLNVSSPSLPNVLEN